MTDDPATSTAACGKPGVARHGRAAARRARLIEAARALFTQLGFHGAGIAQIAKLSGVAVPQIYRDFTCKEDIVAAIVEVDLGTFLAEEALCRAIENKDGHAIRRWIADLVLNKASRQASPLLPEIMAESSRNERIAAILRCTDARIRTRLVAALAALLPASVEPERLGVAADLVLTLMTGLCCRDGAGLQADREFMVSHVQSLIDQEIEALLTQSRS